MRARSLVSSLALFGFSATAVVIYATAAERPLATRVVTPPPGEAASGLTRLALESPAGDTPIDHRIRGLQDMLQRQPKKVDGWILLGRAFVKKARQDTEPGYYANARACATRALELKPSYALALDLQAMVLMNEHRFEEAMALVQQVLDRDPDDLHALGTLADAALELGKVDVALEAVERMVDLKPSLPSYSRVAHLRWMHGDVAGAKHAYKLAMDAGRGSKDTEPLAWVIVEAATIFLYEGDIAGARVGFDSALITRPDFPPARVGLGRVELAEGRPALAAAHFEAAYADSPLAETAWLWTEALEVAGRAGEAAQARAKAEKLGRHGEHRVLAAMLAAEGRDLDAATAAIERELKGRGDANTHATHALVLLRTGRLAEARAAMDRARQLNTPDPLLMLHDGLITLEEGRQRAGRKLLEAALEHEAALMPSAIAEARARLGKRAS